MITDYFLKFASKEEALQVFSTIPEHTYTPYNPETNEFLDTLEVKAQTETFAIIEVGVLYENDESYSDPDLETGKMNIITPPTKIEGYHYNYRIVYGNKEEPPLPIELTPYLVFPLTPKQTFL